VQYGIEFWGSSPLIEKVFKIQKNVLRRIYNLGWAESCRDTFFENKILTVPSLYIYMVLILTYNNIQSYSRPNKDSRHSNLLLYPKHKSAKFEKGAMYSGLKLFNKLPQQIKSCSTQRLFKSQLKQFLLSKVFYSVKEYLEYNDM